MSESSILWCVIAIIIVLFILFKTNLYENFSETENRKVFNLFTNTQSQNGTIADFNNALSSNNIKFTATGGSAPFNKYSEMFKSYNKDDLSLKKIDNIRTN